MTISKVAAGGRYGTIVCHAEVPCFHPPKILYDFMEDFKDGDTKMYMCEGNRKFIATEYDDQYLTQRKCVSIAIIP